LSKQCREIQILTDFHGHGLQDLAALFSLTATSSANVDVLGQLQVTQEPEPDKKKELIVSVTLRRHIMQISKKAAT
jgi:hypothetical protein